MRVTSESGRSAAGSSIQRHQVLITQSIRLRATPGPGLNRLCPQARAQASPSPGWAVPNTGLSVTSFLCLQPWPFSFSLFPSPLRPTPCDRHILSLNVSTRLDQARVTQSSTEPIWADWNYCRSHLFCVDNVVQFWKRNPNSHLHGSGIVFLPQNKPTVHIIAQFKLEQALNDTGRAVRMQSPSTFVECSLISYGFFIHA